MENRWNMQHLYKDNDLDSDGVITLHKRSDGWRVAVNYQSDLTTGQEYEGLSASEALVRVRELNQKFDLHYGAHHALEALVVEVARQ